MQSFSAAGPSTPLAALDCVALDTETTGLDARTARIVQIGTVRIVDSALDETRSLERLVNPGIPIPPLSSKVHGISDGHVANAPRFADVAGELQSLLQGSYVVGHTIGYDLAILQREASLAGIDWTTPRALDVRTLAELAQPGLAQYDLDRIAASLGVEVDGRHTALGDAIATARIFIALLPLLRQRGIRTVGEAETASRLLTDRQVSGGIAVMQVSAGAGPSEALTRIDSFPYRHRLAAVMSTPAWCPAEAPLKAAMHEMMESRISSVLIGAPDKDPGILTERDVLRALDKLGASALELPAGEIASRPLQSLRDSDYVYRAIGRIDRLGIRHLAVADGAGRIVGIVSTRDLLRQRASSAILLGDGIDAATSATALAKIWASLTPMARSLLAEDVDPRHVAAVISTEICALARRAAELAEERMRADGRGGPPVPYALLVLGSAGRGESLLAADQDHALVYASGAPGGPEDDWFKALGQHISDTLDEAGVPYCKGGVMSSTTAWRHSVAGWQALTDDWIRRQSPQDLLNVDIFFDGAVVHGDAGLGETILAYAFNQAQKARDFLQQMTLMAPRAAPPISWMGKLKTDADGRLDLKLHGLMPVFTAARVLAIRYGIRARSTPERLKAVADLGIGSSNDIEQLDEAHRVVIGQMLAQQLADQEAGLPLSPRIVPAKLDETTRRKLKTALQTIPIAAALANEGRLV